MKRTVLLLDDEQNMLTVMRMVLEDANYHVLSATRGEEALTHLANPDLEVIVTDLRMPGMSGEQFIQHARRERPNVPIIVVTAHGTIRSAVASIHAGANDYLTKPFEPEALEIAVHNAVKLHDILRENDRLKAQVSQNAATAPRIVGHSPATQQLREKILEAAPYKSNVLIMGESGTGKELVARAIHDSSPRSGEAWVAINCAAIPKDLLESELFGYVKGAFTGAQQNRMGRLEQAQGGTLFLDEIGDLDLPLQAKLLRVLQEREFSPLGSNVLRKADIRFIAATNRDLKTLATEGKFREDLYYRLDVYSITVPSLRERRADIRVLAYHFLNEIGRDIDKPVTDFSPAAFDIMERYDWPGNIRELRNAVERSLLSCRGTCIEVKDLPGALLKSSEFPPVSERRAATVLPPGVELETWLEDLERAAILNALAQCDGVQTNAAKSLGITERSLWHRIKKLNIQISKQAR